MRLNETNGIRYLTFATLARVPGLWHGVFLRHARNGQTGGISLNLGLHGIDPEERVWENRRRVMAVAGASLGVFAHQVHGVQAGVWDASAAGRRNSASGFVRLSGDALITDQPGAALFIQTADCQSVMLVDPVRRVAANIHSGWRGSIGNVIGNTIEQMAARFGCRPGDLFGAVGPSLGPCCAEFVHYRHEIPRQYWGYRRPGDLFDFWRLSVDQMAAEGVPRQHVAVSGICTRCNQHLFYSYRGEGRQAGRFAAVIGLKN